MSSPRSPLRVVVIGNGMVGHQFVELVAASSANVDLTIFGEEPRAAYDRVNLSTLFAGKTPEDLALGEPGFYAAAARTLYLADPVVSIDRVARRVTSAQGRSVAYDKLVLATGSAPFIPPLPGRDAHGCFAYRTIEDLGAIRAHAESARTGVVIGGGLLGLEAANAVKNLSLETHVVEIAPRLMALQLDDTGAAALRRRIEATGVQIHTGAATEAIIAEHGRVRALRFADGEELAADLVVFSAGIRPRDELARSAGLELGPRGGIAVDERGRTSDPDVFAIGECASHEGRVYGLISPGNQMARAAAAALLGLGDVTFKGGDCATRLKLLGVEVASFGDGFAATPGARVISFMDGAADIYKKLVVSGDRKRLLGGMLVGDASAYAQLVPLMENGVTLPPNVEDLLLPARRGGGGALGVDALPPAALICTCHGVDKAAICAAISGNRLDAVSGIKTCTRAGTGCGSCVPLLAEILNRELERAGVKVKRQLCEHFAFTRQELYHLLRLGGIRTFDELLTRHGRGRGCELCRPAVASMLASTWNEHVLAPEHASLQDTNDRFLANIQRDGTYSVVPRVPGGEIRPEQLIELGRVAKKFGLYSKITGAQRVDLFGARLEQLPAIWSELIAAGFESGHAYGKALRTVKSCVGSTWCRFGVQDSVALAIKLEHRYKGLRSPHKLKSAVSGCARECAEAQGKDFGVIATEKGYNLYLCGNGGMKPQHAQLFATDLDEDTLIRYLDRFLMFYVRTADRLQRTAPWLNSLEGGIEYLKDVLIRDALGICAELEEQMAHVIDTYRCEWQATLEDPEKLRRFRTFVNDEAPDPTIVFVEERGQRRPASWSEKETLVQLRRSA